MMNASSASAVSSASTSLPAVRRRLTDISSFQLPRFRDCRGPLSLHSELADELREDLDHVGRELEVLRELVEIELDDGGADSGEMKAEVQVMEEDYRRSRAAYRSAVLESKRRIVAQSKSSSERYELSSTFGAAKGSAASTSTDAATGVGGGGQSRAGRGRLGQGGEREDEVQTKSNEVTDALRRTLGTMQVELERSVLSVQMLEDSTKTLRSTSALYDTYASLLLTSSQLVKALEKADWHDRLLIGAAFVFFLLVVGWVIKRRVLDKVVGGVGWWVGGSWKLVRMGLGGTGKSLPTPGIKQGFKIVPEPAPGLGAMQTARGGRVEIIEAAGDAISGSAIAAAASALESTVSDAATSAAAIAASVIPVARDEL